MSYRAIQRNIAKGKSLLAFSIVYAILMRVVYFLSSDGNFQLREFGDAGYLWLYIAPLFSSLLASMSMAALCVAILAMGWNYIDVRNVILREKSVLAPAFIILLFSSHTAFLEISPFLIASVMLLWAIGQLFASYHSPNPAVSCINTAMILMFGSLVSPLLLLFFLVFIIGFSMMNILSGKSVLALILSAVFVYVPAYFVSVATETTEQFFKPFAGLNVDSLSRFPLLNIEIWELVFACLLVVIFGWMCIHNYMTSYKDRIKTRAFISFLGFIQAVSVIAFFTFNYEYKLNIYVAFTSGSMLLAHYFLLTQQRIMIFWFVLLLMGCFIVSYLSF